MSKPLPMISPEMESQLARFVRTGKATPEFLELLDSDRDLQALAEQAFGGEIKSLNDKAQRIALAEGTAGKELEHMAGNIIMGGGADDLDAGARVLCLHCSDLIRSEYRHDFKWCSCHSVAVDGGGSYLKISFANNARYKVISNERDLDTTLVGPRDTSEDRTWCARCEQLVLTSTTEKQMVPVERYNTSTHEPYTKMMERDACKVACSAKAEKKGG